VVGWPGIHTLFVMTLILGVPGGTGTLRAGVGDEGERGADNGVPPVKLYSLERLESIIPRSDAAVRTFLERSREVREQLSETKFRYGPDFTSYYSRYPSGGGIPEEEENVQQWLSVGIRQDLIELLKILPARIDAMESRLDGT